MLSVGAQIISPPSNSEERVRFARAALFREEVVVVVVRWQTRSAGHFFPLKPQLTDLTSFVRGNIHISFPLFNIRSLKIVTSIVVYLSMYNITSRHAFLA